MYRGGVQNQAEKNSKNAFRPVPVQKFTFPDTEKTQRHFIGNWWRIRWKAFRGSYGCGCVSAIPQIGHTSEGSCSDREPRIARFPESLAWNRQNFRMQREAQNELNRTRDRGSSIQNRQPESQPINVWPVRADATTWKIMVVVVTRCNGHALDKVTR